MWGGKGWLGQWKIKEILGGSGFSGFKGFKGERSGFTAIYI